jgi:hypothetical protein
MIHVVANEELTRVAPMVEALASGNFTKLARYGDLTMPEVNTASFSKQPGLNGAGSLQQLLCNLKNEPQPDQ